MFEYKRKIEIKSLSELENWNNNQEDYVEVIVLEWFLPYIANCMEEKRFKDFRKAYIEIIKFTMGYGKINCSPDFFGRGHAVDITNSNIEYYIKRFCGTPLNYDKYMKKMMMEIMVMILDLKRFRGLQKTW